jgi:hypothetical protein
VIRAEENTGSAPAITITDNGVHRTMVRSARLRQALELEGLLKDPTASRMELVEGAIFYRSATSMATESRALLAWGMKAAKTGKTLVTEGSAALPPSAFEERPTGLPEAPVVRYDGYKELPKGAPHSLAALHEVIAKACATVFRVWGWAPVGLVVQIHKTGRAMGMAFSPGLKNRRISLHVNLLTRYDLGSIERTVLHELAHHAREEMYPRPRAQIRDGHDARFCEMLGRVDPTVRGDYQQCRFFNDAVDLQVVAQAAVAAGVVYSRSAGVFVFGHGAGRKLRWRWEPTGTSKWKATWNALVLSEFVTFLKQFPVADRLVLNARYEPAAHAVITDLLPPAQRWTSPAQPVTMLSGVLFARIGTLFKTQHRAQISEAMTE